MALGVTITPANTSILLGESVLFVATPTGYSNASNVGYQWQEFSAEAWGNISAANTATYTRTPSGVGTDLPIRAYVYEGGNNAQSVGSTTTVASVYSTLSTVPTKLDTLHTDLTCIVKAVR